MKSSTQVSAFLVVALATLSQPAIATPSSRLMSQNMIDWRHSSLPIAPQATIKDSDQSSSRSFRVAERAVIIDSDAISVGSKNRTTILECSESQPCVEDLLVIDSYKETFGSDGKIKGASIVMYNTSYAPTAIEVYNSKGEFKSVDFVDGKKGGFKDLGDFLKTAASGIVEPFACVVGKGYQQCLNDLKNGKYGVIRAEKQLKLQVGDVVRISRGSEPARFYAYALQGMDMVDSLISSSEIVKKDSITLKKNFSPELKRKIIEGYIKKKMNDKYTWEMLLKEFGYERSKKAIGNNLDLFNSSLEVAKDIPEDFRKALIDGTVASKVTGDGLSLLIESASKKASIFLDSTLLLSQLTNVYVRSSASEAAYNNPYPLVMAYEKPIKDKTPRVTARFPIAIQAEPSPMLKNAISQNEPKFSFTLVDLNNDGNKEAIVITRPGFCGNRTCPVKILKLDNQKKSYNLLSDIWTSRELNLALLPTKSNGWQDLAVTAFSYETKTIDWYAVKFDGKTYKSSSQKLLQVPQNIILSEKSPSFDLGDFPVRQSVKPIATKPSNKISTAPDPIFKDIIPTIRRDLPRDMVMRLPNSVPHVYKEGSNPQGTKVYAIDPRYTPGVEGDGSYTIDLSQTPNCSSTSCRIGYISTSRKKPNIEDTNSNTESRDNEKSIQIRPNLSGYYFYGRQGNSGFRHNIYWQQDGIWFYLNFRGFEKEEVRQMAASTAVGNIIRPSIGSETKPIESYTKCKVTVENINKYCFRRGDRGTYIQNISSLLGELGYYKGKPSNEFNKKVETSVTKFQQDYRLKLVNGVVENNTLLKMCQAARKGCGPNAESGCYTGSPRGVVSCLNDFKSELEKDRSYFNK